MKKNILISCAILLLLLTGCIEYGSKPPREGFLLRAITKEKLPKLHKTAKDKKDVLLFGKSCLSQASNIEEANLCNVEILEKDSEFDIDDFKQWNEDEKRDIFEIIEKNEKFLNCIIESVNISQATSCREPWHSVTGI
jgi:hypothetical protein